MNMIITNGGCLNFLRATTALAFITTFSSPLYAMDDGDSRTKGLTQQQTKEKSKSANSKSKSGSSQMMRDGDPQRKAGLEDEFLSLNLSKTKRSGLRSRNKGFCSIF